MLSRNLEKTLHQTLAYANERRHAYATLEHLLLALTEDADAVDTLLACKVDLPRLRRDALKYIDGASATFAQDPEAESATTQAASSKETDELVPEESKPTKRFQRVLQRAAIHVQSSGRKEATGANVLVAMFAERASPAVLLLQEQEMTRFDAVNYISHGITKSQHEETKVARARVEDWQQIAAFVADHSDSFLTAREGRVDLAPTRGSYDTISSRIEAARLAIGDLINMCGQGNQQHAALGNYAKDYHNELNKLGPSDPGIIWYVVAQKVENYRSNYVAVSKQQPDEYPPLDPGFSTVVDAVVLATGILARLFPEIAKSQDDFEKYAGRQLGVRRAERGLLDATLSDLAVSEGVLTTRAAAAARVIGQLEPGSTPESAPEMARSIATKSGFVRGFFSAIAKVILETAQVQIGHIRDNIQTKGLYDISKEIVKNIGARGIRADSRFPGRCGARFD